jgi:hypothetical protein
VLGRIARRHIRAAAAADPEAPIRFSEMLPAPDECWLAGGDGPDAGRRYFGTSLGTSISRLRILPVGPLGSSSTNQTRRGYL